MIRRLGPVFLVLVCVACRSSAVPAETHTVLASAATLVAFEGELQTTATSGSGAPMGTRTYSLKAGRMRIDDDSVPGDPTTFIDDFDAKTIVVLHPAERSFEPSTPNEAGAAVAPRTPKIDKAGTTDRVSGFECQIWRVTDSRERTELCVASGLWFRTLDPRIRVTLSSLGVADEAFEDGSFPVRARTLDATGRVTWTVTVTHLTRRSIADAAFAVPPGYVPKTDFGFGFH